MDIIRNAIWYERYRPTTLDELVLVPDTRALLESYIQAQDFPHLLLYGRAGSGKTTIANILTRLIPCEVLTLNASGKDRGIETMRGLVVDFARSAAPKGKLKVVFLDEADGMTAESQAALKNTMETYNKSCRFIMTANNVGKIIEPVWSRCTGIPLTEFSVENAGKMLQFIGYKEGCQVSYEDACRVAQRFYPDMRATVNNFQRACSGGVFDFTKISAASTSTTEILEYIQEGKIRSIRKAIAGMTDFMCFYTEMFDKIGELFAEGELTEKAAVALCEHLHYDPTVPDREINFVTCCITWSFLANAQPNFNK